MTGDGDGDEGGDDAGDDAGDELVTRRGDDAGEGDGERWSLRQMAQKATAAPTPEADYDFGSGGGLRIRRLRRWSKKHFEGGPD